MSAKPTLDDSRWAVTAGGADAVNLTTPSSGEKDTGYVTNQVPTSGKLNRLFRQVFAWFKWLDNEIPMTITQAVPFIAPTAGNVLLPADVGWAGTNSGWMVFIVSPPVGRKIMTIRARVKDNATGGGTRVRMLIAKSVDGVYTTLGGSVTTAGALGTIQLLTLDNSAQAAIAALTQYIIFFDSTGSTDLVHLYNLEYDHASV